MSEVRDEEYDRDAHRRAVGLDLLRAATRVEPSPRIAGIYAEALLAEREELRAFVRRIAGTYSMDRDELRAQQEDARSLLERVP